MEFPKARMPEKLTRGQKLMTVLYNHPALTTASKEWADKVSPENGLIKVYHSHNSGKGVIDKYLSVLDSDVLDKTWSLVVADYEDDIITDAMRQMDSASSYETVSPVMIDILFQYAVFGEADISMRYLD